MNFLFGWTQVPKTFLKCSGQPSPTCKTFEGSGEQSLPDRELNDSPTPPNPTHSASVPIDQSERGRLGHELYGQAIGPICADASSGAGGFDLARCLSRAAAARASSLERRPTPLEEYRRAKGEDIEAIDEYRRAQQRKQRETIFSQTMQQLLVDEIPSNFAPMPSHVRGIRDENTHDIGPAAAAPVARLISTDAANRWRQASQRARSTAESRMRRQFLNADQESERLMGNAKIDTSRRGARYGASQAHRARLLREKRGQHEATPTPPTTSTPTLSEAAGVFGLSASGVAASSTSAFDSPPETSTGGSSWPANPLGGSNNIWHPPPHVVEMTPRPQLNRIPRYSSSVGSSVELGSIELEASVVPPPQFLPRQLSFDADWTYSDSIHGNMKFPGIFQAIAQTQIFSRLKDVKQLGPAQWVTPGATHNRYAHSLGVAYLGMELVRNLKHATALKITNMDLLIVGLAGMLHDIGHCAFSHHFEHLVNEYGEDGLAEGTMTPEEAGLYIGFQHEHASKRLIDVLWDLPELFDPLMAYGLRSAQVKNAIQALIIPPKAYKKILKEWMAVEHSDDFGREDDGTEEERGAAAWREAARRKIWDSIFTKEKYGGLIPYEKAWILEIISNERNGLDVDKFDYIIRDLKHAAVLYKEFIHFPEKYPDPVSAVFNYIRTAQVLSDGPLLPTLALPEESVDDARSILKARKHLHEYLYRQEHVLQYDEMLGEAIKLIDTDGSVYPPSGSSYDGLLKMTEVAAKFTMLGSDSSDGLELWKAYCTITDSFMLGKMVQPSPTSPEQQLAHETYINMYMLNKFPPSLGNYKLPDDFNPKTDLPKWIEDSDEDAFVQDVARRYHEWYTKHFRYVMQTYELSAAYFDNNQIVMPHDNKFVPYSRDFIQAAPLAIVKPRTLEQDVKLCGWKTFVDKHSASPHSKELDVDDACDDSVTSYDISRIGMKLVKSNFHMGKKDQDPIKNVWVLPSSEGSAAGFPKTQTEAPYMSQKHMILVDPTVWPTSAPGHMFNGGSGEYRFDESGAEPVRHFSVDEAVNDDAVRWTMHGLRLAMKAAANRESPGSSTHGDKWLVGIEFLDDAALVLSDEILAEKILTVYGNDNDHNLAVYGDAPNIARSTLMRRETILPSTRELLGSISFVRDPARDPLTREAYRTNRELLNADPSTRIVYMYVDASLWKASGARSQYLGRQVRETVRALSSAFHTFVEDDSLHVLGRTWPGTSQFDEIKAPSSSFRSDFFAEATKGRNRPVLAKFPRFDLRVEEKFHKENFRV